MSYPICKIKNLRNEQKTLIKTFSANEEYTIQDSERFDWLVETVMDAISGDDPDFEIGDLNGYNFDDSVEQWNHLSMKILEVVPTTPVNDHNMKGRKHKIALVASDFIETPVDSGIYKASSYFKVESSTHKELKLWGAKIKINNHNIEDEVKLWITDHEELLLAAYGQDFVNTYYPDYPRLKWYADWYLDVEDGKISCEKPPSGSPGSVPRNMYIEFVLTCLDNTGRTGRVNLVITEKDGDEL